MRKNKTLRLLALVLCFAMVCGLCLSACGKQEAQEPAQTEEPAQTPEQTPEETTEPEEPAQPEEPETPEEPAAASDKAILVVSFGTSFNNSRNITIGGVENALREAFPDYQIRRAFTAQIIIDKLAQRDGIVIDNVTEALDRAVADGIKTLVVQPTHLMNGFEYTDLKDELDKYADKFEKLALAEPLLTSEEDFSAVADAIMAKTAAYDDGKTAIVFMGHGTEAESNGVYAHMQEVLAGKNAANYYIGTVEAEPSLEDVLGAIEGKGYEKVVLEPLMVVAGDHANNDMAGDEEDSWKTAFTGAGYEVTCLLDGLGQVYEAQALYVAHTQAAIDSLGLTVDKSVAVGATQPVQSDKAILVVSFGTSFNNSRNITIGGVENALREAFPDYQIRRAFTAQIIIDKLAQRDGIVIDNVTEALDRAVADGIKTLVVQPTHLMNGFEYTDLKDELDKYADKFEKLALAEPLLTSEEDFSAVADAIMAKTAAYDDGKTAIVFMGHGTEAESNGVYAHMQEVLAGKNAANYYIGTVEAEPSLEDVLGAIEGKGYEKVVLEPLMVVAGDHANNDMAGDEEDSWKTAFTGAGYEVTCLLDGLGQVYEAQALYVAHTQAAIDSLG